MSWDVILTRLPHDITSVHELPKGFPEVPIGSLEGVCSAVRTAVPEADLTDEGRWGVRGELLGPSWSMELSLGTADPVAMIMLFIRGDGDDVLPQIFRLAAALDCRPVDCSSGELINPGDLSGWHGFQEFRDRATGAG